MKKMTSEQLPHNQLTTAKTNDIRMKKDKFRGGMWLYQPPNRTKRWCSILFLLKAPSHSITTVLHCILELNSSLTRCIPDSHELVEANVILQKVPLDVPWSNHLFNYFLSTSIKFEPTIYVLVVATSGARYAPGSGNAIVYLGLCCIFLIIWYYDGCSVC